MTHARARSVVGGDDEHELVALAEDDVDGVEATHPSANRVRHSAEESNGRTMKRERASVELSETGDARGTSSAARGDARGIAMTGANASWKSKKTRGARAREMPPRVGETVVDVEACPVVVSERSVASFSTPGRRGGRSDRKTSVRPTGRGPGRFS